MSKIQKFFLSASFGLVLAACSVSGPRNAVPTYDFGPAPSMQSVSTRQFALTLETHAPRWLDSTALQYRLNYSDPAVLQAYSLARWAAPPSQLIDLRLRQLLGLDGAGQGRGRCVLVVEVDEFSQNFSSQTVSQALLNGRMQLLDAARRPVAAQRFNITVPAATPDAAGGVGALTGSVDRLATDIAGWLDGVASQSGAACLR